MLFWFKHAVIWKLQRIEFSSKVCRSVFCKLCKTIQLSQNHNLLILWWFESVLKGFYVKIAENWIFRHSLLSLLPWHVLQIGVMQITEHEMAKSGNLKYLTEVLGQNGLNHVTFMTPINTLLQKVHFSFKKYNLTKMTSQKNGISQLHYCFCEVVSTQCL